MRADAHDRIVALRQQRDVDTAVVVPVDQHHVCVRSGLDPLEQDLLELDQRRPVIGLDDGKNVGTDVAHDLGRVLGRDLVDRRHLQLDPADPRGPPVSDDLDLALRALEKPATVLAQLGVGAAVVLAAKPERPQ